VSTSKAVTPEEELDESGNTQDAGVRIVGSSGLRSLRMPHVRWKSTKKTQRVAIRPKN